MKIVKSIATGVLLAGMVTGVSTASLLAGMALNVKLVKKAWQSRAGFLTVH